MKLCGVGGGGWGEGGGGWWGFFFNDTATTEIYTLSLHDALPICSWGGMSAAVLANRNPSIKAMASYDGTETHYFGETDTNIYANSVSGETNDQFIQEIHDSNLLSTGNQDIRYLYFESGDKIDDFVPSNEYHYFKKLNAQKYYLRFTNSSHADFVCIPSILNSSQQSVTIYKNLEEATVLFFNASLTGAGTFNSYWKDLKLLDYTTDKPYDLIKKEEKEEEKGKRGKKEKREEKEKNGE